MAGPYTITATLNDVGATNLQGSAFVRFKLRNFSGFVPRVTGTAIVAETQIDSFPNGSGLVSQVLWGNSDLTPSTTFYTVEFWDQGRITSSGNYLITANTNLGTAPQMNTPPVPAGFSFVLQTNGVVNGNQNLLNLQAGPNITIVDNGTGTDTISATGAAAFNTSGQGFFLGAQSYAPVQENSGITLATANQVVAVQLMLPFAITISKVSLYVVTGSGSGFMCAGLYSADGNTKLIDAGTNAFDVHTNSQALRSNNITPVTLQPGTYWFAVGDTVASSGSVVGHNLYTWLANLFNANVTRFGTAANAISGGVMPSTLGAITPFTNITAVAVPAVLFQV